MSKDKQKNKPVDETAERVAEESETGSTENGAQETAEVTVETILAELEAAKQESEQFRDRWMRSVAELENFRRRVARENEERVLRAGERIIGQFIEPVDNLARGIRSAKSSVERLDVPNPEMSAFIQGMELVYNQFMAILEREQVKVMEPVGSPFDPNLHEALMMTESADVPPNTVVDVVERGYWIGEKVLKHAKVVVCRAPSAPSDEEE